MHDSASQQVAPADGEPHGGSGLEIGVRCTMDSGTSLGWGGGTLVSCRSNEGSCGIGRGLVVHEAIVPCDTY